MPISGKEAVHCLDALKRTAIAVVEYVGNANYYHRERVAKRAIEQSARTGEFVDPDETYDV
jgi:hypothetical protein